MLVSTTSTPFTIAISTAPRPYPGVQCVWKSTGIDKFCLNNGINSAIRDGEIKPLISLIVTISAPSAAICFALSRKYSFVNTGAGFFLPFNLSQKPSFGYFGSIV